MTHDFQFLDQNNLFLMQHTSISPDRGLIAIVGDHKDGLLVDSQNGKVHSVSGLCSFLTVVLKSYCISLKGPFFFTRCFPFPPFPSSSFVFCVMQRHETMRSLSFWR